MENSTYKPQAEKSWPTHWLPKPWVMALHKKFSLLYLQKFTSAFPDDETIDEWASLWAESLGGLDGDQIKFGLSYCAQRHEWPPTTAEFLACCKALPRATERLPYNPPIDRVAGSRRLAEIVAKLAEPKSKPVLHWRRVMATPGLPEISYRYAREALAIIDSNMPVEVTSEAA